MNELARLLELLGSLSAAMIVIGLALGVSMWLRRKRPGVAL
jgi:hypothetical protein